MNNSLVSIIIPTYNRAHLIGEALDSVLAQTYENWECIVVDDGSTDATETIVLDYVKKDVRFKFHERPSNKPKGASSSRNYGVSLAKGELLIFLDSDDTLKPHCLDVRLQTIANNLDFSFWVFPMEIRKKSGIVTKKNIPEKSDYLESFLENKIFWGIMCTTWDKNFFLRINGFNENYLRLNDPEIHIRAILEANNKYKVFFNHNPDSIYNQDFIKDNFSFAIKYHNTLSLFISDTVDLLNKYKKEKLRKRLKGYLLLWMQFFQNYSSFKMSCDVLKLFRKERVINPLEYLVLYLLMFVEIVVLKIIDFFKKKIYHLILSK